MKNNGTKRRRFRSGKRIMSFMLILALYFAMMPNSVARAAGIDIDKDSVDENYESVWSGDEFGLNYDIPTGTYGSIVIPATEVENPVPYHLTINGTTVTADSVEIQSGATLHIFDKVDENGTVTSEGRLNSSTITPQDGARMELGNSSNIPAGIHVYDFFYNEESGGDVLTDISSDGAWGWFTFVYVDDGNGDYKWIREPDEYERFGGTEEKPVVIEAVVRDYAEYDFEGQGFPIHFPGTISVEDTFNGGDKMKARVSSETTSIDFSWDPENAPTQICVRGAGENGGWLILDVTENQTSYTLNLNQPYEVFYCVEFKYGSGEPGPEEPSYNLFESLQPELDATYFAFGDINGSGSADGEDLKIWCYENTL